MVIIAINVFKDKGLSCSIAVLNLLFLINVNYFPCSCSSLEICYAFCLNVFFNEKGKKLFRGLATVLFPNSVLCLAILTILHYSIRDTRISFSYYGFNLLLQLFCNKRFVCLTSSFKMCFLRFFLISCLSTLISDLSSGSFVLVVFIVVSAIQGIHIIVGLMRLLYIPYFRSVD